MKKIVIFILCFFSVSILAFALDGRKCGFYIKEGVTSPQLATEPMDCETFEHVLGNWYKDKNNVYYYHDNNSMYIGFEALAGRDPKKFQAVGEGESNNALLEGKIYYAKDEKFLYVHSLSHTNGDEIIKNANLKSFQILSDGYSKDKKNVYYFGETMEYADPKTFKIAHDKDKYDSKDRLFYYKYGKLVGIDAPNICNYFW